MDIVGWTLTHCAVALFGFRHATNGCMCLLAWKKEEEKIYIFGVTCPYFVSPILFLRMMRATQTAATTITAHRWNASLSLSLSLLYYYAAIWTVVFVLRVCYVCCVKNSSSCNFCPSQPKNVSFLFCQPSAWFDKNYKRSFSCVWICYLFHLYSRIKTVKDDYLLITSKIFFK